MTNMNYEVRKQTRGKNKMLAGVSTGIAVLLLLIGGRAVANRKKTINLNDYLTVEVTGFDGYGEAYAEIDWDAFEEKYVRGIMV